VNTGVHDASVAGHVPPGGKPVSIVAEHSRRHPRRHRRRRRRRRRRGGGCVVPHPTSTTPPGRRQCRSTLADSLRQFLVENRQSGRRRLLAADGDGVGVVTASRDLDTRGTLRRRRLDDSVD